MTTFSQLVDTIMSESRRPDLQTEIATYINQTVRELHFDSEQNKILYFNDNIREVQLTATSESDFSWEITNPGVWQKLWTVAYASKLNYDGQPKRSEDHTSEIQTQMRISYSGLSLKQ